MAMDSRRGMKRWKRPYSSWSEVASLFSSFVPGIMFASKSMINEFLKMAYRLRKEIESSSSSPILKLNIGSIVPLKSLSWQIREISKMPDSSLKSRANTERMAVSRSVERMPCDNMVPARLKTFMLLGTVSAAS